MGSVLKVIAATVWFVCCYLVGYKLGLWIGKWYIARQERKLRGTAHEQWEEVINGNVEVEEGK